VSPLVIALAVAVGLSLGLLGGGGSILTVPILVYAAGFAPKEAIATSLAIVGAASLLGVLSHWRDGNVNLRVAGLFGAVAMIGTLVGSRLAMFLSGSTQLVLFSVVMLAAAFFMLRGASSAALEPSRPERSGAALAPLALVALATGALTGLVGVGGGFLIVPALVLLLGVPMKQAVGTSLAVIVMNSAVGFLGYADQVAINWAAAGIFVAAAGAGIMIGSALTRVVPAQRLRSGFAFLLVGMAAFVLYQNRLGFIPA
jgi:uncharacterized membrane protein YfcA